MQHACQRVSLQPNLHDPAGTSNRCSSACETAKHNSCCPHHSNQDMTSQQHAHTTCRLTAAAEAAMHLHHCAHNIPQPVHPPALQMTRKRRQAFHVHPPHQQIQVALSTSEGPMTARDPTRMPFQEVHAFQHNFWLPVAHICKKQGLHKHSRACAAAAASAQPAGQHTRHAPGRHQTPIHTDIVLGCQPRMRKAREL